MLRDSDKKMLNARSAGRFLAIFLTCSHKKLTILSDERHLIYIPAATSTWWAEALRDPSDDGWRLWDPSDCTGMQRSRLGNL